MLAIGSGTKMKLSFLMICCCAIISTHAITLSRDNITVFFSDNIKLAEDQFTVVQSPEQVVLITDKVKNFTRTLDRGNGYKVEVNVMEINLRPRFKARNYSVHEVFPNQDVIDKYCTTPVPEYYTITKNAPVVNSMASKVPCTECIPPRDVLIRTTGQCTPFSADNTTIVIVNEANWTEAQSCNTTCQSMNLTCYYCNKTLGANNTSCIGNCTQATQYCNACGPCMPNKLSTYKLTPFFNPSSWACDIRFIEQEPLFQVSYTMFNGNTKILSAIGNDTSKSEGAEPSVFSSGVSTFAGLFGITHNLTRSKPLEYSYLLMGYNNGSSLCAKPFKLLPQEAIDNVLSLLPYFGFLLQGSEFTSDSVDISTINTGMWKNLTYSAMLSVTSKFTVQQFMQLLNTVNATIITDFVRNGFSMANLPEIPEVFHPYNIDSSPLSCQSVTQLNNSIYEFPLDSSLPSVLIVDFLEGTSFLEAIGPRGLVILERIRVNMDLYNGTNSTIARFAAKRASSNSTNSTTDNNYINDLLFNVSVSANFTQCQPNSQTITVGLMMDKVEKMRYDILVYSYIKDNMQVCEFTAHFLVPGYMTGMTNLSKGQTTRVSVLIQDTGAPYQIYPYYQYEPEDFVVFHPVNISSFHATRRQKQTLYSISAGFGVILLLWVFFFYYAYKTRPNKKDTKKISFTDWSSPATRICYAIQEKLSGSADGYEAHVKVKRRIAIGCMLLGGIAKAVTFSFSMFVILFLKYNNDDIQYIKTFPDYYRETQVEVTNISIAIEIYKTMEIQRQNYDYGNQTEDCNSQMALLDAYIQDEEKRIIDATDAKMNLCDIEKLQSDYVKLMDDKKNENFQNLFIDYYKKISLDYDTGYAWMKFARIIYKICSFFGGCDDQPDKDMPEKPPPIPDIGQLPSTRLPEHTQEPKRVDPLPPKENPKRTVFSNYRAPNLSIHIPDIKFDFSFAHQISLRLLVASFILDIILIVRKICRAFKNAADLLHGLDEEEEAEIEMFAANSNIALNLSKADRKEVTKMKMKRVGGMVISSIANITTKAASTLKKWPVVVYVIQHLFLIAIIGCIFVFLIVIVGIILAPGQVESLGLVDVVIQPIDFSIAISNTAISQTAYNLNKQLADQEGAGNSRMRSSEINANAFNAQQATAIQSYNTSIQEMKQQYNTSKQEFPPQCVPIKQIDLNPPYDQYRCNFTPITAQPYRFEIELYRARLTESFNAYVAALRNLLKKSLYFLAGFIGFFLILKIGYAILVKFLTHIGAVKINTKIWYYKKEDFSQTDYQTKDQIIVNQLIESLDDKELSKHFSNVIKAIPVLLTQYSSSNTTSVHMSSDVEMANLSPNMVPSPSQQKLLPNQTEKATSYATHRQDIGEEQPGVYTIAKLQHDTCALIDHLFSRPEYARLIKNQTESEQKDFVQNIASEPGKIQLKLLYLRLWAVSKVNAVQRLRAGEIKVYGANSTKDLKHYM